MSIKTILETDFPSWELSQIAEKESWRKEVYKPATHTHKWWATRLGSVFKGIICASLTETPEEFWEAYRENKKFNATLLDPFAGSGTTLVEAAKLGIKIVGIDINPVATMVQRQALQEWDIKELTNAFNLLKTKCSEKILSYYKNKNGETVLYYFWVALGVCNSCKKTTELFNNYIFSKNAYPTKHPESKAICPVCHEIVDVLYNDEKFTCINNHTSLVDGPVNRNKYICSCGKENIVVNTLNQKRPSYRMYAKLVLKKDGSKAYEKIDEFDLKKYKDLSEEFEKIKDELVQPQGELKPGVNTNQAIRWNFKSWRDFFNERQLLSLGILASEITKLSIDKKSKEALTTLFSGTLEFNNMFCSFKGEGTGAVRHMFSNHILHPERTPLEANPWGTKQSSGSFLSLFTSRILRADSYKKNPYDIYQSAPGTFIKTLKNNKFTGEVVDKWYDEVDPKQKHLILNCSSSDIPVVPNKSIDIVITDPPYMDNVNYSELADFFHSWLKKMKPYPNYPDGDTTRDTKEVQSDNPKNFEMLISKVWFECKRVLKDDGLLAFTYHQSKVDGWIALVSSLKNAGFVITALQPIKGEMSTSLTKAGVGEPNYLDTIVVCRKKDYCQENKASIENDIKYTFEKIKNLEKHGLKIGKGDYKSFIRGSVFSNFTYSNELSLMDLKLLAEKKVNEQV